MYMTAARDGSELTPIDSYYCRYFLVGTVTATDHLMVTALVCYLRLPQSLR